MHSSTFKVKPHEFQDFTDAMIDLLEDQTRLFYDQDAKDAVMQIKEVCTCIVLRKHTLTEIIFTTFVFRIDPGARQNRQLTI